MLLWMLALLFVWLLLQVRPDPVFEGDVLTLQCLSMNSKNIKLSQVKFYRDGNFLNSSGDNQTLSMGRAAAKSSGQYHCSGMLTYIPELVVRKTSEVITVRVQELFPPPVLSAASFPVYREGNPVTLRCETKLHPQRSASRLFVHFHKNGQALQSWTLHQEFCIPRAQEGDSGLYWCQAAIEGGGVQKKSAQFEIRVQVPVSRPLITFQSGAAGLAEGDTVELLCEAENGSSPILYLFYHNGEIMGNHSAPQGGAASILFLVKSEQDAGNYSCEAVNNVSREMSELRKLP
ncbi:PREDICTED: Fc receptor-like protein 6 [Elephantulus edwardii]|uniref:Fc receptor-like protein 6 n=1 Tax=Elephantulus edwardii TaxID=28737 RepID=UPI0003F091EB|nr:PREDICTED: Fc receptor-like protein 6 [Elephantulus edwardii]